MEISTVFDSGETIKGEDLQGREFTLVISTVAVKKFDDGTRKLIIHFQNAKKALVCNKTNAEGIGYMYGTDTDGWIGREIVLYFDPMVLYAGKRVGGVRVKPPARRTANEVHAATQPVKTAPAPRQMSVASGTVVERDGYALHTMTDRQPAISPNDMGDQEIPF